MHVAMVEVKWSSCFWKASVFPEPTDSWSFSPKMHFLTFWRSSAWVNGPNYLLKKTFATWQHAFLCTSIAFNDSLLRHAQESKFWGDLQYVSRLFFTFPFFSLSYLFAAVIDLLLALLPIQNFLENGIKMGNFYHWVVKCSPQTFYCEFFTKISENFRLHWANRSKLGIIAKIFNFLQQNLSIYDVNIIVVKGDEVRSGTKADIRHDLSRAARESVG